MAHETFDLVLLDCQMPGPDGFATARQLRANLEEEPRLPILALTAHALDVHRDRALNAGMDDHLRKPVWLEELRHALDRWLARMTSIGRCWIGPRRASRALAAAARGVSCWFGGFPQTLLRLA